MEVSFQRRLNQSFMVIESAEREVFEVLENPPKDGIEEKRLVLNMLANNQVSGLLSPEFELTDGRGRYRYDITGKQSLSDYLQRKGAGADFFRLLFSSFERLLDQLSAYMLEENSLVLEIDYIYLDFSGECLYLTYLPDWNKDAREQLRELMECLLQKINHEDKEAVTLGYDMYQLILQSDMSFSGMLKKLCEKEVTSVRKDEFSHELMEEAERNGVKENDFFKEKAERNIQIQEEEFLPREESITWSSLRNGKEVKNFRTQPMEEEILPREKEENIPWLSLGKGKEKEIKNIQPIENPLTKQFLPKEKISMWSLRKEQERKIVGTQGMDREDNRKIKESFWDKLKFHKESRSTYEAYEEPEEEIRCVHPTEYLGSTPQAIGKLLYQGREGYPNIDLSKDLMIIGKDSEQVDICMEAKSISRVHAKIEKKRDTYYIEDLNSTNGTFLDGERMEYHQKLRLVKGARIAFGVEEYVFL
ncbi:hypothetical protein FACS1894111_08380 [Clostridia bacterium]|nr:hypothetical protein FACS1894111_08380 [Clostridia bacterium]